MKIALGTLAIGGEYKNKVKYGQKVKKLYCEKYDYDYIDDESVVVHDRPYEWSKIKLVLKYLKNYDFFVWMDADLHIMNFDKKLEDFIDIMKNDQDLMYANDGYWVNNGVMFIRNTRFIHEVFEECWKHTGHICNEQGALDYLYRINWKNCAKKYVIKPGKLFNCWWFEYEWGDFIVHFPGSKEPGRQKNGLKRMMDMFCPIRMDEESMENYEKRIDWLKNNASTELKEMKIICNQRGLYFPLDM